MNDTVSLRTVQARVQRGAKWLDKNKKGWAPLINITTLRVQGAHECLAGQLKIWDKVPNIEQARNLGFYDESATVTHKGKTTGSDWSGAAYPYMQRLWTKQIKRRLNKAKRLQKELHALIG